MPSLTSTEVRRLLAIEAAATNLVSLPADEVGEDYLAAMLNLCNAITPFMPKTKEEPTAHGAAPTFPDLIRLAAMPGDKKWFHILKRMPAHFPCHAGNGGCFLCMLRGQIADGLCGPALVAVRKRMNEYIGGMVLNMEKFPSDLNGPTPPGWLVELEMVLELVERHGDESHMRG